MFLSMRHEYRTRCMKYLLHVLYVRVCFLISEGETNTFSFVTHFVSRNLLTGPLMSPSLILLLQLARLSNDNQPELQLPLKRQKMTIIFHEGQHWARWVI